MEGSTCNFVSSDSFNGCLEFSNSSSSAITSIASGGMGSTGGGDVVGGGGDSGAETGEDFGGR